MKQLKIVLIAVLLVTLFLSISSVVSAEAPPEDEHQSMNVEEIEEFPEIESMRTEFAKAYQTSDDIVTYVVNS